MTSYSGENTAKNMEAARRDAKARQARGTGARRQNTNRGDADVKEASKFVPRHHLGEFTPETRQALNDWQTSQPRAALIGAKAMYEFAQHGIVIGTGDKAITVPLKFTLTGEDARLIGLNGTEVVVDKNGISAADGKPLAMDVWSVTVLLNSGASPAFGLRFSFDVNRATQKRDILSVH